MTDDGLVAYVRPLVVNDPFFRWEYVVEDLTGGTEVAGGVTVRRATAQRKARRALRRERKRRERAWQYVEVIWE